VGEHHYSGFWWAGAVTEEGDYGGAGRRGLGEENQMGRLLGRVLVVACMGVVAGLTYVGSASATVPATGRFTNPVSGIDYGVSATCGFQVLGLTP
jgi:hypothetical protein